MSAHADTNMPIFDNMDMPARSETDASVSERPTVADDTKPNMPRFIYAVAVLVTGTAGMLAIFGLMCVSIARYDERTQYRCVNASDGSRLRNLCNSIGDTTSCQVGSTCAVDVCGTKMGPALDISVAGSDHGASIPVAGAAGLFIFWSSVPYLLAVGLATWALLFRTDAALSPIVLLVILTIFNEGILKNAILQDRPEGSCLYGLSYGMPSG